MARIDLQLVRYFGKLNLLRDQFGYEAHALNPDMRTRHWRVFAFLGLKISRFGIDLAEMAEFQRDGIFSGLQQFSPLDELYQRFAPDFGGFGGGWLRKMPPARRLLAAVFQKREHG